MAVIAADDPLIADDDPLIADDDPLIAADDLPCMHVLTVAPRPHRYESGGRHTIVARGRCMIAHSFTGLIFGPAQALHGCTYVIDARLSADGLLEDSEPACTRAEAELALADALRVYHQRNLDDLAELAGENTTCERVGRALWCRMAAALPFSSRSGLAPISELEIVVRESDVAWAAYRRRLGPRCRCNTRPRPTSGSIATQPRWCYSPTARATRARPTGSPTTAGFEASSAESNASSRTSRHLLPAPGSRGSSDLAQSSSGARDEVRAPVVCLAWAVRVRGR